MRSLDQLSSGSSCSPVLSDDSLENHHQPFYRMGAAGHSRTSSMCDYSRNAFEGGHLLMPVNHMSYASSARYRQFGELPLNIPRAEGAISSDFYSAPSAPSISGDNRKSDFGMLGCVETNRYEEPKPDTANFERPARGKVKICGVCGDRAKSFHFGAISCDSCKAFFRRSVQNEAYKNFHCPYNNRCDITILSRKCCQHCR